MKIALILLSTLVLTPLAALQAADASKPVKVFLLAGQSNMEGKAPNALLDHQATNATTKALFAHLRKNERWIVRDDVFIKFLERKGPLTVGYGSPGRTGPELEFGTVVGDCFEEPVILIKAAWGAALARQTFPFPFGWVSRRSRAREGIEAGAGTRHQEQREEQEE
jgi:alpha-galactosidase